MNSQFECCFVDFSRRGEGLRGSCFPGFSNPILPNTSKSYLRARSAAFLEFCFEVALYWLLPFAKAISIFLVCHALFLCAYLSQLVLGKLLSMLHIYIRLTFLNFLAFHFLRLMFSLATFFALFRALNLLYIINNINYFTFKDLNQYIQNKPAKQYFVQFYFNTVKCIIVKIQYMSEKVKISSKKVTIDLTPIQLVWLHSQHEFQRIQQQALALGHEIKFYKNNTGVQLRYQKQPQDKTYDALQKAKDQLVVKVQQNELRLMRTSLDKDLYVRISRQARKQFPRSYIIFLHYETFQNCCRKLKQKFSITSITIQLEKLRKQNPYFCFLVAEKSKIDQIQKFTDRLLKSEVSCASTTFSQKQRDRADESLLHYRRTMSVSSLKGSYASFNSQKDRNQLDHCRISLQPSETEEEMFEVSEVTLVNLTVAELDRVNKRKTFTGTRVYVQNYEGNYLSMKKKLYYANRLQLCSNPQIQPVYAYSMVEGQSNKWKLSLVTDRHYEKLSQHLDSVWFHSFKMKIQVFIQIAKALIWLHRNRQSYGDLKDSNILLNSERQIILSCIIDKNVPPHTNPFDYDVRQFLLLVYKIFTQVQMTYDCLMKKIDGQSFFCTLAHRCRNKLLKEFLVIADNLFIQDINLQQFAKQASNLIKKI